MGFFSKVMGKPEEAKEEEEGYVELGAGSEEESRAKIVVRPFVVKDFENIKEILDALREGHTIALINIRPLKDKDLVELKRVVNKLKKTCDAIEGDIAGFGDDWIAAVPSFAHIHRQTKGDKDEKPAEAAEVTEYSSAEEEQEPIE